MVSLDMGKTIAGGMVGFFESKNISMTDLLGTGAKIGAGFLAKKIMTPALNTGMMRIIRGGSVWNGEIDAKSLKVKGVSHRFTTELAEKELDFIKVLNSITILLDDSKEHAGLHKEMFRKAVHNLTLCIKFREIISKFDVKKDDPVVASEVLCGVMELQRGFENIFLPQFEKFLLEHCLITEFHLPGSVRTVKGFMSSLQAEFNGACSIPISHAQYHLRHIETLHYKNMLAAIRKEEARGRRARKQQARRKNR
jgi:hypothetical protein